MNHKPEYTITATTQNHTVEIVDGHLTIQGKQETLSPDETEQLLNVLLIWRYGLEAIPVEDLEH